LAHSALLRVDGRRFEPGFEVDAGAVRRGLRQLPHFYLFGLILGIIRAVSAASTADIRSPQTKPYLLNQFDFIEFEAEAK